MASPPAPRKAPATRRKADSKPPAIETPRPVRAKKPKPPSAPPASKLRIIECDVATSDSAFARARALGFDSVLLRLGRIARPPFDLSAVRPRANAAQAAGLNVILDIQLHQVDAEWSLAHDHPTWFRHIVADQWPVDPRRDLLASELLPRFDHPEAISGLTSAFAATLREAVSHGLAGFALNWPQRIPVTALRRLVDMVRDDNDDATLIAWTPGLSRDERLALQDAKLSASLCSLPWWDYRSPWFMDEVADLRKVGHVIAPVEWAKENDERALRALTRAASVASLVGDGWLVRHGDDLLRSSSSPSDGIVQSTNASFAASPRVRARPVSAPWARVGAWTTSGSARAVTLINADLDHHASIPVTALEADAGVVLDSISGVLAPGEVRRVTLPDDDAVDFDIADNAVDTTIASPRVVIESISPLVDEGQFPAKRVVGDTITVEADVFADGHPVLAVRLLWKTQDAAEWNRVRMRALGNDRWRAEFALRRQGAHEFTVEAGIDEFAGLRSGLDKKVAAGQNVTLDVEEARLFIESASTSAPADFRAGLRNLAHEISVARDPAARVLAPDVADLMATANAPAFLSRATVTGRVIAERRAASFASWYELFPRSLGRDGKHGTFSDVISELPRIQNMGFDVLYFPPIHPIGLKNRKGKNNSLNADASQPGSPYAIGGVEGGHDAIHPQLGTLEDFLALVDAARAHGLELALDFAVQCSPDHPWIKQHPEWFAWRPDGSMRYAENPPKKYEDIVNVDFYAAEAKPALWLALRDVVAFWLRQGVKIFRVDNPHTKPLPFWEWLIADLRARDSDVMFLSEAFTRPKLMYRLAKIGFSQSYSYFTWRNTRAELETYLTELNTSPVRDFFRPHFFVNTPDIDPYFLQNSGRAGFLIRAALATTLSGLWGMYSGFELCEAAALPGKEEYLDSEKYELRPRDWNAPGNITADITQLNRIRRDNPALHTHLGVTFYTCSNSNILYFGKTTPSRDNVVLVAINLDPHNAQEADIELPLWEFGLDDSAALLAEELTGNHAFDWRGKYQHIRLEPVSPYRIWRVRSEKDR